MRRLCLLICVMMSPSVWAVDCDGDLYLGLARYHEVQDTSTIETSYGCDTSQRMGEVDVDFSGSVEVLMTDVIDPDGDQSLAVRLDELSGSVQLEKIEIAAGITSGYTGIAFDSVCIDPTSCWSYIHQPFDALDMSSRIGVPMIRLGSGKTELFVLHRPFDVRNVRNVDYMEGVPYGMKINPVTYEHDVGFGAKLGAGGDVHVESIIYSGPSLTPTQLRVNPSLGTITPFNEHEEMVSFAGQGFIGDVNLRGLIRFSDRSGDSTTRLLALEVEKIFATEYADHFFELAVTHANGSCDARIDAQCVYYEGYSSVNYQMQYPSFTIGAKHAEKFDHRAQFTEVFVSQFSGPMTLTVSVQLPRGDDDTFFGLNKHHKNVSLAFGIDF